MLKKLENLSDRLLNRFVPATTAAASCPCGSYPYTGPCWWFTSCDGGGVRACYCGDNARQLSCSDCV